VSRLGIAMVRLYLRKREVSSRERGDAAFKFSALGVLTLEDRLRGKAEGSPSSCALCALGVSPFRGLPDLSVLLFLETPNFAPRLTGATVRGCTCRGSVISVAIEDFR
jgi:hypothetical protein